ncbi:MAG: YceI family protein [Ginsengibacter sp.]
MKQKIFFLSLLLTSTFFPNKKLIAQEYFTKNGSISFFSKASLENISADNNQVISLLNTQSGTLRFYLLVNAFHFSKAMMEEHFNSDYMESDKYPSASFKGVIDNIVSIDAGKDATYQVTVTGTLEIHGVSKGVTTAGTVTVKAGIISATSVFKIQLKDYNIKIPSIVVNNIAEEIEVTLNCRYQKRTSN